MASGGRLDEHEDDMMIQFWGVSWVEAHRGMLSTAAHLDSWCSSARGRRRGRCWSSSCNRGIRRCSGTPGRDGCFGGGPEVNVNVKPLAAEETEGNQ
jgi:hypothetical protein